MRIGRHCCWQLGLILGHGVGSWADCRACEKHWNRGECGVAPQAGHAALASRACLFSALHCRVRWSGAPTLVQPHCDVKYFTFCSTPAHGESARMLTPTHWMKLRSMTEERVFGYIAYQGSWCEPSQAKMPCTSAQSKGRLSSCLLECPACITSHHSEGARVANTAFAYPPNLRAPLISDELEGALAAISSALAQFFHRGHHDSYWMSTTHSVAGLL